MPISRAPGAWRVAYRRLGGDAGRARRAPVCRALPVGNARARALRKFPNPISVDFISGAGGAPQVVSRGPLCCWCAQGRPSWRAPPLIKIVVGQLLLAGWPNSATQSKQLFAIRATFLIHAAAAAAFVDAVACQSGAPKVTPSRALNKWRPANELWPQAAAGPAAFKWQMARPGAARLRVN